MKRLQRAGAAGVFSRVVADINRTYDDGIAALRRSIDDPMGDGRKDLVEEDNERAKAARARSLRRGKTKVSLEDVRAFVESLGPGASKLREAIASRFPVDRSTAGRYLRKIRSKSK